jgi:hypothetical protein
MLLAHRSWPELLFHVLAHVPSTAPASLSDARYVAYCRERLGDVSARPLADDARLLSQLLGQHASLARAQLLAWLFDDVDAHHAVADVDVAALRPEQVTRRALLRSLASLGPPLELLRCAAELERETWLRLPPIDVDAAALVAALGECALAAPTLGDHHILSLRALRLRGRVMGDEIWIGAAGADLELSVAHVAWQAAHEATVSEVGRLDRAVDERLVERVALVLLCERARAAGLAEAHRRWLAHLAEAPTDPALLDAHGQRLLARARSG